MTNSSRSPRYRSLANSIGRPWTSQVVRVMWSAGASGWVAALSGQCVKLGYLEPLMQVREFEVASGPQ